MDIKKSVYLQNVFDKYSITVTDSGFAKVSSEWDDKNVCSPFSRIYYVLKGCAELETGDEKIKLSEGNFYLIPLGMRFSRRCIECFEHLYFHVNISSPSGYDLMKNTICVGKKISSEEIENLIDLYFSTQFTNQMELGCRMCGHLKELLELQPKKHENSVSLSPEVQKTIEYIKKHLSIQLTAEEIAGDLYMSKNTLSKKFTAEMGIPMGKYIDKLVFYEAEKLLTDSRMTIGDISSSLGFSDRFYFSRRFKQIFEETPLEYRKRTAKNAT